MSNQHVMTLEDPAGLLITMELLEQIGVSAGDKVEIKISDRALTVRLPLGGMLIDTYGPRGATAAGLVR